DVAARSRQACNKSAPNRIRCEREDNGDDRGRLLYIEERASRRNDDIDLEPDELGGYFVIPLTSSFRPAILDREVTTLNPTEFAQPPHESSGPSAPGQRRARAHQPDARPTLA